MGSEMTASEPLSLEEEYEMQQSWYEDEQKCTFIILSPKFVRNQVPAGKAQKIWGGMVGDVNLFLNDFDDATRAEIEVMIAEEDARHSGIGSEALGMMMRYAVEVLQLKTLYAKILFKNTQSINLFKKFGFQEVSRSEVFQEVTLERIFLDSKDSVEVVARFFWKMEEYD